MKIIKQSNYVASPNFKSDEQFIHIDKDLKNIVLGLTGRIRFGSGIDSTRGENISGEFRQFTSSATASSTNTILHTLGAVPIGWLLVSQDNDGVLYLSTKNNLDIRLVSTTTSTTYTIFLLK